MASDDQVSELHTQIEGVVQRMGGSVEKTENWGRRKLAYEIGHQKEGIYVLEVITGGGELMKEIDRRLKVTEGFAPPDCARRRVDDQGGARRAKRTEESRRRRVARGLPPDRQPGEGPQGENEDDSRHDVRFADMEDIIMAGGEGGRPGGREGRRQRRQGKDRRRGGGFFRRRKVCKFCADKIDDINYKDSSC